MNINIYDDNLLKIAIIDNYTSLIWCKRYYDVGAVDLQIEATTETIKLLKKDYYITRDDDDAIYQIKTIELNTAENYDNSLLIGAVECKDILAQRIIYDVFNYSGTVESFIRKIVNENVISPSITNRKIENFYLANAKGFTDSVTLQTNHETLSEKIIELCKTYNLGWKIIFVDNNFYFDLYRGNDKTKEIVFSPHYDNLASSKYEYDSSKYKNVALVLGEGEGIEQKTTTVGSGTGLKRYETVIDASSMSSNIESETDLALYYQQLATKGKEELAKLSATTSFEGVVIPDNLIYKVDFDLGDIVKIQNEYGISVNARIVEIIEAFDESGYTLEPTFEYMEVVETESVDGALLTESSVMMLSESGVALLSESSTAESGIRISELEETTDINDGCCLPIVQEGETKKVYYSTIKNKVTPTFEIVDNDLIARFEE